MVGVGFPSLLSSIETPDSAEIIIEVRVKKNINNQSVLAIGTWPKYTQSDGKMSKLKPECGLKLQARFTARKFIFSDPYLLSL